MEASSLKEAEMVTKTQPYVVANGQTAPATETRSGWVTFAGIVLLVGAVADLFWGLAALDKSQDFLTESGLLYGTLNTWGWIAIGWSALLLIGSIALLARTSWGPVVGIVLASISCVFWLFTMPVMPMLALTVILIDVFVIYGLAVHSTE
jgi:hypothetical protein